LQRDNKQLRKRARDGVTKRFCDRYKRWKKAGNVGRGYHEHNKRGFCMKGRDGERDGERGVMDEGRQSIYVIRR